MPTLKTNLDRATTLHFGFRTIVKTLVAVFTMTLLVAVVVLFLPDRNLDDELALPRESDYTLEDSKRNLHLMIWGFDAPKGTSIVQEGMTIVRDLTEALKAHSAVEPGAFDEMEYGTPGKRITFPAHDKLCKPETQLCFREYRHQLSMGHSQIDEDGRLAVERYILFYGATVNIAIPPPDINAPFPNYAPIVMAHRLYLQTLAVEYLQEKEHAALLKLEADIEFLRWSLTQATDMMEKMIFAAMLADDLYFLAEALDEEKAPASFLKNIDSLTTEERSVRKPTLREARTTNSVFDKIAGSPEILSGDFQIPIWLSTRIFKKNFTSNWVYSKYKYVAQLGDLSPGEFAQEINHGEILSRPPRRLPWYVYLYTPVTVIFESGWDDDTFRFDDYIGRLHNLNGLITLINLKRAIRLAGVTKGNITPYLERVKKKWKNPYTKEAVMWNPDDGTLYFEATGPRSKFNSIRLDI